MPAINFRDIFSEKIELGEKRQTVRKIRKNPIKIGDPLFLYTGQRTKEAKLIKKTKCTLALQTKIEKNGLSFIYSPTDVGFSSGISALNAFSRREGFEDWAELLVFFDKQYGLPFEGVLIQW